MISNNAFLCAQLMIALSKRNSSSVIVKQAPPSGGVLLYKIEIIFGEDNCRYVLADKIIACFFLIIHYTYKGLLRSCL
jgi:hypothetical protein